MRLYSIARRGLLLVGHHYTFAALAIVLLFANGIHGQPLDALPALVWWYLILAGCRLVGRMLPVPAADPFMKETPLPAAAVAVSITPAAASVACPDFATMAARLPPNVGRLLRQLS